MAPLTPTKSFFRKLKTLLKSDKASELQLLTAKLVCRKKKNKICYLRSAEEIRDFRCWLVHKQLFHHPHMQSLPRGVHAPLVSRQGGGEGTAEQSYCAGRSPSVCWSEQGDQSSCFSASLGRSRKILPLPPYTWRASSRQDWKQAGRKGCLPRVEKGLPEKSLSYPDKYRTFRLNTAVILCISLNGAGESLILIQFQIKKPKF